MDIICVDAKFSEDQLKYWSQFGVVPPDQDKFYTVRDVIINSNGKNGLLLNELSNPKIPIDHPLMGPGTMIEPNWDSKRFRTINGDEVDAIAIKREIEVTV